MQTPVAQVARPGSGRVSVPLAFVRRILAAGRAQKPVPQAQTRHIVSGVTPKELAGYLQRGLGVADPQVVQNNGHLEMPFRIWGMEGAKVAVSACSVGSTFTMTGPPTADAGEAIANAVKIGRLGIIASEAAVRDLTPGVAPRDGAASVNVVEVTVIHLPDL